MHNYYFCSDTLLYLGMQLDDFQFVGIRMNERNFKLHLFLRT